MTSKSVLTKDAEMKSEQVVMISDQPDLWRKCGTPRKTGQGGRESKGQSLGKVSPLGDGVS